VPEVMICFVLISHEEMGRLGEMERKLLEAGRKAFVIVASLTFCNNARDKRVFPAVCSCVPLEPS